MLQPAWILSHTTHPGNVGSAARAIKTMGFSQLILVNPKDPMVKDSSEAIALASGAGDILQDMLISPTLAKACANYSLVFGLSARDREFGPPSISLQDACGLARQAIQTDQACAFLFGTERTGLDNEELQYCTHRVKIDANPSYSSINLAQAVMIAAYEMRRNLPDITSSETLKPLAKRAKLEAIESAMAHLQEGLIAIEFLDPKHPKKLLERLRALFDRAGLQEEEVDLLRGIAKQMLRKPSREWIDLN